MVSEPQRFGVDMWVESLTKLESQCLKCINIVQSAKTDIQTLRSYFSMMEFVDSGIVVDEDEDNGDHIHVKQISGDKICSEELIVKEIAPVKPEHLQYPSLRFVDGGIVVDEDTNSELKIEELLNEDDGVIRLNQLSDESLQEEVHDYRTHRNEEVHKGLIYNEPENDGKPVEVAYIVPENTFIPLSESYRNATHFASVSFSFLISSSSLSRAFLAFMLFSCSVRSSVSQECEAKRPEPKPPDDVGPQYKHFVVSELRCFLYGDEPAAKSTFRITLEVPTELIVLYNMPVYEDHYDGNLKKISLQKSPIMSTYLVVVVIGLFDYVEDHTPEGINVCVYCHVGDSMKRAGVPTVPGSGRLFLFPDSNIWTRFFDENNGGAERPEPKPLVMSSKFVILADKDLSRPEE